MANNRITWQNIDAPDLRDALLGTELSGSMFGKAADTFSDAMNAFAKNRKDRVNAVSWSELRQMTSLSSAVSGNSDVIRLRLLCKTLRQR